MIGCFIVITYFFVVRGASYAVGRPAQGLVDNFEKSCIPMNDGRTEKLLSEIVNCLHLWPTRHNMKDNDKKPITVAAKNSSRPSTMR